MYRLKCYGPGGEKRLVEVMAGPAGPASASTDLSPYRAIGDRLRSIICRCHSGLASSFHRLNAAMEEVLQGCLE